VVTLSGLVEVDANAPYAQWIGRVAAHLRASPAAVLTSSDLPPALAADWQHWLPARALWLPFATRDGALRGGLLYARELPWRELDVRLFREWIDTWVALYRAVHRPGWRARLRRAADRLPRFLRQRPVVAAVVAVGVLLIPVRLSVLAPGELVPANPLVIRAPVDGIIKAFHVQTNETVQADQALFSYDDSVITSRLEVAVEAWRTAEVEERQYRQQALFDAKARSLLTSIRGNVEEKRLEVEYLRSLLERNRVLAPRAGVAFVDDPTDLIGRQVAAGQRILRLAEPDDKEVEVWLPVGDAIDLPPDSPVRLYLNSSPLSPVAARLRYLSFEAQRRPDGHYAYRVRARLDEPTEHRVGLKGTARLSGGRVPLVYWMLRRPLAVLREFLGV
jgi:multidrug efflux pump subunit AcrA (membrane-fusion protein)